jgi:hypothetical protein
MSERALGRTAARKPVAYWKIVALVVPLTFVLELLWYRALSDRMLSAWVGMSIGLSAGFCGWEAIRRSRSKREAA